MIARKTKTSFMASVCVYDVLVCVDVETWKRIQISILSKNLEWCPALPNVEVFHVLPVCAGSLRVTCLRPQDGCYALRRSNNRECGRCGDRKGICFGFLYYIKPMAQSHPGLCLYFLPPTVRAPCRVQLWIVRRLTGSPSVPRSAECCRVNTCPHGNADIHLAARACKYGHAWSLLMF